MKIKPEHFQYIKNEVRRCGVTWVKFKAHREHRAADPKYKDCDVDMLTRWDMVAHCKLSQWFCDTVHPYANDDHIDTALKAVIRDIEASIV